MNDLVRKMEVLDQMTPQMRMILNHVKRVGYITPRAARDDYNIESLSRRICDFKDMGFTVRKETRQNPGTGQRYTRYFLTNNEVAA